MVEEEENPGDIGIPLLSPGYAIMGKFPRPAGPGQANRYHTIKIENIVPNRIVILEAQTAFFSS